MLASRQLRSRIGPRAATSRVSEPPSDLSRATLATLIGRNQPNMRHYKVLRANLWGGQVVLSAFFRYVTQDDLLFVESRIFALPPLKKEFLEYERMPEQTDFKVASLIAAPLSGIPMFLLLTHFCRKDLSHW